MPAIIPFGGPNAVPLPAMGASHPQRIVSSNAVNGGAVTFDARRMLQLVTRRGCHLCDEALAALRSLGREPELLDVDADERLFDAYDWRVPVVLFNEQVIAEGRIDLDRLRQALSG